MRARKSFLAALLVTLTMLGFSYTPAGAQGIQRAISTVSSLMVGPGTTTGAIRFGGFTSSFAMLKANGLTLEAKLADDSGYTNFNAATLQSISAGGFFGMQTPTGVTQIRSVVQLRRGIYATTVDKSAFTCAATTCDVTLTIVSGPTLLAWTLADLTQTFACASTCTTSTLSMVLGKGSGGAEFLASFDADAAVGQFGDVDGELGTLLNRAGTTGTIGALLSWSGGTNIVLRLTSGTGNIGTGAATNLSQGSVTVYLVFDKVT